MTTKRDPYQIQSVVREFITILGGQECARLLGKSESAIYKASDAGSNYKLPAEDYITLDAAIASMRGDADGTPYQTWVANRVRSISGAAQLGHQENLTEAVLDIGGAVGDLQEAVSLAISRNGPGGNGLTRNELIKLRGLVDHLHRELADVDAALGGGLQ